MIAYRRHIDGQELAIYLNLGNEAAEIQAAAGQQSRIILSTFLDRIDEHCQGALSVRGNEGLIVEWFQ
jgi:alpha-glucosidase